MRAAVVTSFDEPPAFGEFPVPTPVSANEVLVDVVASGLHRRVRSQADGSHYTSTGSLPLVPGVDGVGRMANGTLRYFALGDTTSGAMAEQTVIDLRQSFELPTGADPVLVAAAMNPAMSAWVALRRRIDFQAGQSVLVLDATGSSGQMAVQVAKRLGAGQIIAAGRDPQKLAALPGLGADTVVRLGDAHGIGDVAAEVDVVIDYLWGQVTADAMTAIATNRRDGSRPAELDRGRRGRRTGRCDPRRGPACAARADRREWTGLAVDRGAAGRATCGRGSQVAHYVSTPAQSR